MECLAAAVPSRPKSVTRPSYLVLMFYEDATPVDVLEQQIVALERGSDHCVPGNSSYWLGWTPLR